jgi:putative DNA primase/helicase
VSNITASALFRTVEKYRPTLLIDEADSFMTANEEMRGILNSGHRKASAYVLRTTGENFDPRTFATWAPKAIALIGALPDTLEDRSISIRMERKRIGEKTEELRIDRLSEFESLRQRAARWAADIREVLKKADPDIPEAITNARARDNWRPLFAIADAVGGDWPQRAREIAIALSGKESETDSAKILLLRDLHLLFAETGERITSEKIVAYLIEIEGRPWAEWKNSKPITKTGLARLLSAFGIRPAKWREGPETLRGYERADFEGVFDRYLENEPPQTPQAKESIIYSENETPQQSQPVAFVNGRNSAEINDVAFVADENPQEGREIIEL